MGRQAYLIRLALGRGAFLPPELDENGNFILGPHAHDLDNKDHYVQKWDYRGHPKNKESEMLAREFRRAKNEALETMGVVKRKHEESKTAWQRRSDKEKRQLVIREDEAGAVLSLLSAAALPLTTWWVSSLRNRIQVRLGCENWDYIS